jgi:hypothetical protein
MTRVTPTEKKTSERRSRCLRPRCIYWTSSAVFRIAAWRIALPSNGMSRML